MSLTKGLILHCPLDQESYNPATLRFTDKSAHGNHGTACNAAAFSTDHYGIANRSCTFDGSTDCVNCASNTSLDVADEITISYWIKRSTLGAQYAIDKRYSTNFVNYSFGMYSDHTLLFYYRNAANTAWHFWTTTDTCTDTTQFNHLLVTFTYGTGGSIKVYSNNISLPGSWTEGNGNDSPSIHASQVCALGRDNTGGNYVDGQMEDIRIYNRTVAEEERSQLYNSYRPRFIV